MKIEGMSIVRKAIGRLAAVAALASGLAMERPAFAESWKPTLHDADDLHEAAEDLHDRAHRLQDAQAIPITAALEQVTEDLYQGLKRQRCLAEIVPLLSSTQEVLNETSSIIALSCEMRTDRKATSQLNDAQHHFLAVAERVNSTLREHTAPPASQLSQPRSSWQTAPYASQYSQAPGWLERPSPAVTWGSSYPGFSQSYGAPYYNHRHDANYYYQPSVSRPALPPAPPRKLPRVLITGVLTR